MTYRIDLLDKDDVIQPNDYVRQLNLSYNGQSDYLQTTSTYGGCPINRLKWIPAKYMCPAYVGKTVKEFNNGQFEFIRGKVPEEHLEVLTDSQLKNAKMIWKHWKNK